MRRRLTCRAPCALRRSSVSELSLTFDEAGGAVPHEIQLAAGQDVRLESVTAEWDGAGASGTFLACLSLYSQSGQLLSRTFPAQTFAPGDDGEVTYAPPLGEGGSSPAPPSAVSLPSALGSASSRSQTCAGSLPIEFDFVYWNDPSFAYEGVTAGRARYLTITTEGWYLGKFSIFWDTDFTVGDFPFIEPSCFIGGFADVLVNSFAPNWNDTQGIIYGEQFTAAEMDHHSLAATVLFQFTAAGVGDASPGIGVNVRAGGGRTKNFGGQVALTYLGDTLAQQTIV